MLSTTLQELSIKDLLEISLPTHDDDRGFFREVARISHIEKHTGNPFNVLQMNHARSSKNTLRGIHIAPWNKIIYVTRGLVQAVIIDARKGSETYGRHHSIELGDNNRSAIFIPKGCGNSYLVLSEEADYTYLTDEEWAPNKEVGILWNDPALQIDWKLTGHPNLSEKDKVNPLLKEVHKS